MPGRIYVGIAGWSYKDWEGVVYPQTLHGAQRLAYLAEFFDLVEMHEESPEDRIHERR